MSTNEQATRPMPRGRLIVATLGALVVANLIVFGAILPAEFNRDPLGLGRLSGLARLWAPEEKMADVNGGAGPAAREYDIPFREDVVEIPLGGFMTGAEFSELEYKVRMKKGAVLTYSWTATGTDRPDDLFFDQHGHTTPAQGEAMTVSQFRKGAGVKQEGSVVAPFDGIQGWLFQNSAEKTVVVRLKLAGFYELVPGGQPGNEASVAANVPAAQARPTAASALKLTP